MKSSKNVISANAAASRACIFSAHLCHSYIKCILSKIESADFNSHCEPSHSKANTHGVRAIRAFKFC